MAGRHHAAVAHSILRTFWRLLNHDCEYVDLGSRYLEERGRHRIQRRPREFWLHRQTGAASLILPKYGFTAKLSQKTGFME